MNRKKKKMTKKQIKKILKVIMEDDDKVIITVNHTKQIKVSVNATNEEICNEILKSTEEKERG